MPVISTNIAANSSIRFLNINSAAQTSSLSKLASGSRVTQASDDAAGLAISTKISSDVKALNQAATNSSHGVSILQTADGGAAMISDILQRMKALASQSASGTVTDNERSYIDAEFQQLVDEVDAIATGTRYNGQSLLDTTSTFSTGIGIIVGSSAMDQIILKLEALDTSTLGLTFGAAPVTSVGAAGADGTPAKTAGLSMGTSAEAHTIPPGGMQFEINGVLVTIDNATAAPIPQTLDAIFNAISAALALESSPTFTIQSYGTPPNSLVMRSTTPGAGHPITVTDVGGGPVPNAVRNALGLSGYTDDGEDGVPGLPATITGTGINVVLSGPMTFSINGTQVTLAVGTHTPQHIADEINAATGGAGVTASVVGGVLTIQSTALGSGATITIDNFVGGDATDLGFAASPAAGAVSVATQQDAVDAVGIIDQASGAVSLARANIGSLESRFGFHLASIATSVENLTAATAAILDTDVATEAAKLASSKVKTQAAVAAATQASQMPQDLLKLLQ